MPSTNTLVKYQKNAKTMTDSNVKLSMQMGSRIDVRIGHGIVRGIGTFLAFGTCICRWH